MKAKVYQTKKRNTFLLLPKGKSLDSIPANVVQRLRRPLNPKTVLVGLDVITADPDEVTDDFKLRGYSIRQTETTFSVSEEAPATNLMQTSVPEPSWQYLSAQRELQLLLERSASSTAARRRGLASFLEQEFMKAWGLKSDSHKRARHLRMELHPASGGLDHCTFYCEPAANALVIITQPFNDRVQEFRRGLALGKWMKPEIISAPKWAFYYPGKATLVVLKFPPGYDTMVRAIRRCQRQAALNAESDAVNRD